MRKFPAFLAAAAIAAGAIGAIPAHAANSAADILGANKAATGGKAWDGKAAFKASYSYAGQGMTGKTEGIADLKDGRFVDSFQIGPMTGAQGFDGKVAWSKDTSGTVTVQNGGDQRQIAVNEAYRDANLWWRSDRGGAEITSDGTKTENGVTYDVLSVTPKGGKLFRAWFDTKTHLLARVIEVQGPQTITTTLSNYKPIDGVEVAQDTLVSTGDKKYDQKMTLLGANFVGAQPASVFTPPKVKVADFTIAGGASETSFPFVLINNHIYADVEVNGKGPFRFIFDTGGVNLLTPPLVAQLGLKSEGDMQGNGAGSGHMKVSFTKVASLEVGKASVSDQVFAVMPLDTMANTEGAPMPGMVGYETFRRFVTRVDYGTHTMTLIKPEAFDPKHAGTAVPIAFDGNTIEAKATFDGVTGNFTVDTGSRASLTLNAPFVKANGLRAKAGKGVEAVSGWGVGGPSRAYVTRGDTLVLGGHTIKGPVVEMSTDTGGAFSASSQAGNIGAGILKRFIVTLDYDHATMYLKPVTVAVSDLDTFDRSGMWINASAGGFTVVDITKSGPAEKAGLQKNDTITAVDGKPASTLKLYELRQRLRDEAPGTVVDLTVSRGGKTRDVKLTLQDQI